MPKLRNQDLAIGQRLKNIRRKNNISQDALAALINVSYPQIQKYENGLNGLSIRRLKQLSAALGVRPCEICGCCDE
jgi:transcriptional regulator with XRE-family HTH domain